MLKKVLFTSLITLSLLSCQSDDYKGQATSRNNAKIELVSGIYKTIRGSATNPPEDKAFLHIADDGKVTVYDDQMDTKDNGSNCYKLATLSTQINSTLHNGITTYDSSNSIYIITKGTNTLSFTYTDTDGMKNFSFNNGTSSFAVAGTSIDVNTATTNISLGKPSNKKDSSITKSTLDNSTCP